MHTVAAGTQHGAKPLTRRHAFHSELEYPSTDNEDEAAANDRDIGADHAGDFDHYEIEANDANALDVDDGNAVDINDGAGPTEDHAVEMDTLALPLPHIYETLPLATKVRVSVSAHEYYITTISQRSIEAARTKIERSLTEVYKAEGYYIDALKSELRARGCLRQEEGEYLHAVADYYELTAKIGPLNPNIKYHPLIDPASSDAVERAKYRGLGKRLRED